MGKAAAEQGTSKQTHTPNLSNSTRILILIGISMEALKGQLRAWSHEPNERHFYLFFSYLYCIELWWPSILYIKSLIFPFVLTLLIHIFQFETLYTYIYPIAKEHCTLKEQKGGKTETK